MSAYASEFGKVFVFLISPFFVIHVFAHTITGSEVFHDPSNDQVIYFNVQKNGYTLDFKWGTSPDAYVFDFTIETSKSTEVWAPLNNIRASEAREYRLKGLTPKWSTAYYRLKIRDTKGKYSYTKPVKVSLYYRDLDNLTVYPNPLSSNVSTKLKFSRQILRGSKVSVFSINGIHQFDHVIQKDTDIIELPPLEAGNYFIEIADASEVQRLKVAVK